MVQVADQIKILLVEDDAADAQLIRRLISRRRFNSEVTELNDGEKAIRELKEISAGKGSQPDLVILDLNLPLKDGFEILSFIRGDSKLKELTVIVLTASTNDADKLRSLSLKANGFVSKNNGFKTFTNDILTAIEDYWNDRSKSK